MQLRKHLATLCMQRVTWLGTSEALGSVTLGVYRVKKQEAGAGRAEEEDQEARGYTPHTWGSPDWPRKQREMPYQWAWGIQSVQPW